MSHDPLCPEPECERSCAGWCDDASHYCQCDLIAKVRADEGKQAIRQAVIDTLRYTAQTSWADMVESHSPTSVVCAFCQEVGCDHDCPLRHTREQPDGWTDTDPGMAPGWTDA